MPSVEVKTIRPNEFALAAQRGGTTVIDVRTPVEFREVHVEGAVNLPLDGFDPNELAGRDGPVFVLCRSGGRATKACEQLLASGVMGATVVEGGTLACVEAGLPVTRDKQTISLERQVRIAAGSLVTLGALLGWLVHPGWFGLSAFVGAGLVFAGVTDTCGMGMVLARMPWNQK